MSAWVDCILKEFISDLSRLWIAADPDGMLLDERLLAGLRERGFDLLPFEDSVAFRAEYETRYRATWDRGDDGPAKALILQLRSMTTGELPWDYLRRARRVSLSLADLFSKLSYSVIRQIPLEHYDVLYTSQARYATQTLGESATKEFVLTHIFKLSPHLISRPEDLWRELLRLHYRDAALPPVLADHVAEVLSDVPAFKALPLEAMFVSKATMLRVVQDAWYFYLSARGITGTRIGESLAVDFAGKAEIPFEHPDVRAIVDSMFLEGLLHPLSVTGGQPSVPDWAKVGIVRDPLTLRNLVDEGIKGLRQTLPGLGSSFRDWMSAARKLGELIARFHSLDSARAQGLETAMGELQAAADESLQQWVRKHYADLPSLSAAKAPVMVHHIPRYLSMRRDSGQDRIALLVFDGLAIDQWVLIREALAKRAPDMGFDEGVCFAWAPTLTSVSRQAIFSGMRPREFAHSIESTGSEPIQWARFWQDQGLRNNEVIYRKGIQRNDHLEDLAVALNNPNVKVAGLVIDTVDEIVHGAVLGKRGVAAQIASWLDTGFVERLLHLLLSNGYNVYLTADHGNVDAIGHGRPKQGVAAELRGERVRTYRSEALAAESAASTSNTYRLDIAGLPTDFLTLFAGERTAFTLQGEQAVVHGGISIEELLVPFVRVSFVSN